MPKHQLEISVTDASGQRVEGAAVMAKPEAKGHPLDAVFDAQRQLYYIDGLRPGFFDLSVRHPDYRAHRQRVQVHPKPTRIVCVLTSPEATHTFRGATPVPYNSEPELLGVIPAPPSGGEEDEDGQTLGTLLASLGLVPEGANEEEDETGAGGAAEQGGVAAGLVVRRTRNFAKDETADGGEGEELRVLRESPLVDAAGPLFQRSATSFSVFTNRLVVRFRPEVTNEQVRTLLEAMRLRILRPLAFAPNQFLVEADPRIGEGINGLAEQLLNSRLVVTAEPSIAEVPEEDGIVPRDYLWPAGWDRKLVGVEGAWQQLFNAKGADEQFGSPRVVIAVVDNGIKSQGGLPENDDFQGTVSDGSSKVYQLYDFRPSVPRPDNDMQAGSRPDHGVACASVAAGRTINMSSSLDVGVGLAGAAPNTRLMGLIRPTRDTDLLEMFLWAAGTNSKTRPANYPLPISPGADIFTCSLGLGQGAPLSDAAQRMFDYITTRGRNGKGCLAFFSAGNANLDINKAPDWHRPFGSYERSFSCAASTLDPHGQEVRASYSGFGRVSWCAPSASSAPSAPHNPPRSYGILSATFTNQGYLPSFPDFTTILKTPAHAGDTRITLDKVSGLPANAYILIGEPGINGSERAKINGTPNAATGVVKVHTALVNNHTATVEVASGPNNHRDDFGGTSAATPLCAGICALVLSAQPDLTWVEAREILRTTAVRIDKHNPDMVGQWLDGEDEDDTPSTVLPIRSGWYGFGRLDADAAVAAALAYTFPRDLMIRSTLDDTGEAETDPDADSPDIWVRNTDPAVDGEDAYPPDYDTPGPHEDPSDSGSRWLFARVRNRGTEPSYDAWVRFYVASSRGTSFQYPQDWEPANGIQNFQSGNWEPGTYFIGEVVLDSIEPGESITVDIPWPTTLMPPELTPAGDSWRPHILVEITPHDGPVKGTATHQNNNLAQRAVNILRP